MEAKEHVLAMFPTARTEVNAGVFQLAGVLRTFDVKAISEDLLWDAAIRYCNDTVKRQYDLRMEHASRVAASAPTLDNILNDPGRSDWLKNSLRLAVERDPVDAVRDAEYLVTLLTQRLKKFPP